MGVRGIVELLVQRDEQKAQAGRFVGIKADEPDIFPLLAHGHQHGLAVVEHLGLAVEHVVGLRGRDDDIKAGEGLGEPLGQLGRSLNHQHLIIALGFEVGQNARQDVIGALDRRQERVLVGIVELLERLRVDHRGDAQLDGAGRDDKAGLKNLLKTASGSTLATTILVVSPRPLSKSPSASPTPTFRSSALRARAL